MKIFYTFPDILPEKIKWFTLLARLSHGMNYIAGGKCKNITEGKL